MPDVIDSWLTPAFRNDYKEQHRDLYGRMIRLFHTLAILRKIDGFPFNELVLPEQLTFWATVAENSNHEAAIVLYGLVGDTTPDHLSLPVFRNRVRDWLIPCRVAEYNATAGRVKMTPQQEIATRTLRDFRNIRVAHRLISTVAKHTPGQQPGVAWPEIDSLFAFARCLFNAVSMDCDCKLAMMGYGDGAIYPPGQREPPADIDLILDDLARRSQAVNFPETHPELWPIRRGIMQPHVLEAVNCGRRRIGLPPV